MKSNFNELNKKIKELKIKLEKLILEKEDLNDPEIIKTSQMLDDVLNMLNDGNNKNTHNSS